MNLRQACEHGDAEAGAVQDRTPLHWACSEGYEACAQLLVEPNDYGWTPLHRACAHGCLF